MTIVRCFSPARFTPPTHIHGRYVPPDIQPLHTTPFKALRPQKKTFREEQALATVHGCDQRRCDKSSSDAFLSTQVTTNRSQDRAIPTHRKLRGVVENLVLNIEIEAIHVDIASHIGL